jgi:citrate synthase
VAPDQASCQRAQRRVLDATLIAIAEHGLVPSVQASRMHGGTEALQEAVATGSWLRVGRTGIVRAGREFFAAIVTRANGGALSRRAPEDCGVVRRAKAIPGYGHPLHRGGDPRAQRLPEVSAEAGASGRHIEAAQIVERLLPETTGKTLVMNVSGAIPAVLLDVGYPVRALKGVPIVARTAGLVAHLLEEQLRPIGFVLSHAGAGAIDYDGAAPPGFVPSHE